MMTYQPHCRWPEKCQNANVRKIVPQSCRNIFELAAGISGWNVLEMHWMEMEVDRPGVHPHPVVYFQRCKPGQEMISKFRKTCVEKFPVFYLPRSTKGNTSRFLQCILQPWPLAGWVFFRACRCWEEVRV